MPENKSKYFLFALLLITTHFTGFSQSEEPGKNMDERLRKLKWEMELGTGFVYSPGFGGTTRYYAAPGFTSPLFGNFSLHAGLIAGVETMPSLNRKGEGNMALSTMNYFSAVYGSLSYSLNERWMVYGSGIRYFSFPAPGTPASFPAFNEYRFGSQFKLSENVSIGASVGYRDHNPFQAFQPFQSGINEW